MNCYEFAGFPRFYFLSNDELLSILSQTRNPRSVQEHLCKCFDSMNCVIFEEGNTISAMKDHAGEVVQFEKIVSTNKSVEHWLCDIENQMIAGLYVDAKQALGAYPEDGTKRKEWLFGMSHKSVHPSWSGLTERKEVLLSGCFVLNLKMHSFQQNT